MNTEKEKYKFIVSAKEAHALSKQGVEIHWTNCQQCNDLFASTKPLLFCSENCSKLNEQFLLLVKKKEEWIISNNYAGQNDLVNFNGKKLKVLITNVNGYILAENNSIEFFYVLIDGTETHTLRKLKEPLKSI